MLENLLMNDGHLKSLQNVLEVVSPRNPLELRLETISTITNSRSQEMKMLNEDNFLAIWYQLADLIPSTSHLTSQKLALFIMEAHRVNQTSRTIQKFLLHFLCNSFANGVCKASGSHAHVWIPLIRSVSKILETINLPDDCLELSTSVKCFIEFFEISVEVDFCAELVDSINKHMLAHLGCFDDIVIYRYLETLVSHLSRHADQERCIKISSDCILNLMTTKASVFDLKSVNRIISSCESPGIYNKIDCMVPLLSALSKSEVWGSMALRQLCLVIEALSRENSNCQLSLINLLNEVLWGSEFQPFLFHLVYGTLSVILEHCSVENYQIDSEVLVIIERSLRKHLLQPSQEFLFIADVYGLFSKCVYRQKRRVESCRESGNVTSLVEKILCYQIEYFEEKILESSSAKCDFINILDSSLDVTTFQFKVKVFNFLFNSSKVPDSNWLNRFEVYLHLLLLTPTKDSTYTACQEALIKKLQTFVSSHRIKLLYEVEVMNVIREVGLKIKWNNLNTEHAIVLFKFFFDFCSTSTIDISDYLTSFDTIIASAVTVDSMATAASQVAKDQTIVECYVEHVVSLCQTLFEKANLWGTYAALPNCFSLLLDRVFNVATLVLKNPDNVNWNPTMRKSLFKFLESSKLLRLFDSGDEVCENLVNSAENCLIVGMKLVFSCLRNEKDWNVFEAIVTQLPKFLKKQDIVEKIFAGRIMEKIETKNNEDEPISLVYTFLEQLVLELCSLLDLRQSAFKIRFQTSLPNLYGPAGTLSKDQYSIYRSHIFQCLNCMITYPLEVKTRKIIQCFTNGVVDSKYGASCLCALSVCLLECPELCSRSIPTILDNIYRVKSSRSMSVPALDLIFMLSQLPNLQHNLRCEDHQQIVSVILQFVDYQSYSKYCVEVALNLLCVWFLKCKVSYRPQLVKLIIEELEATVDKLERELNVLNQPRTHSRSIASESLNASNIQGSVNSLDSAEKLTTKSDSPMEGLLRLQRDALEICRSLITKHIFSETLSQPKRSSISEFLLANGVSKSWIVGDRIVTITTSGNFCKLSENGLCDACNERIEKSKQVVASTKTTDHRRHKSTPQNSNIKDRTMETAATQYMSSVSSTSEMTDSTSWKHCSCWITGWAEVYIRTPTGNISYLTRTQSEGSNPIMNGNVSLDKMNCFLSNILLTPYDRRDSAATDTSNSGSVDLLDSISSRDCTNLETIAENGFMAPRKSIVGLTSSKIPELLDILPTLIRSKSMNDISQLTATKLSAKVKTNKKECVTIEATKPSRTSNKKQRHVSLFTFGNRSSRSHTRNFSGEPNSTPISSNYDFCNPATVFYQLLASPISAPKVSDKGASLEISKTTPVYLPDNEIVRDEIAFFDNYFPFNIHKVGLLYVDVGQGTDDTAVLSNICGSNRYTEFMRGLGSVIELRECDKGDFRIYNGGLDKSCNERHGKLTVCWVEDLFQIMFHVATLMPTPDPSEDPHCSVKRALIGNDAVIIVYNDSTVTPLIEPVIQTQLNFISIVVTPTDSKRHSVKLMCKPELEPWILHESREQKIVSDCNLPIYVRQMALHASMACHGYLFKQKNFEYTSNWSMRLDIIRKLKAKFLFSSNPFQ